jgi:hypothetical protein
MRRTPEKSPDFDITTRWALDARPEELTTIVLDPELLHVWCPTVFMHGELVERGRADGLGMAIRLHTKGFLPHSFFFLARIVDVVPHRFMRIAVSGDFEGIGELSVTPDRGAGCNAELHWQTSVRHPWLRPLVRSLHPIFVWNHKWAMRHARKLMQAEVDRRREAGGCLVRARATFPHGFAAVREWQRRRSGTVRWRDENEQAS